MTFKINPIPRYEIEIDGYTAEMLTFHQISHMVASYKASKACEKIPGVKAGWDDSVYEDEGYYVQTYIAFEEEDPFQTQFLFFDMEDNNIANIEISYEDLLPFMTELTVHLMGSLSQPLFVNNAQYVL